MAYIRFNIDGAVKKTNYDALPTATKIAIRDRIRELKSYCQKINEGPAQSGKHSQVQVAYLSP